MEIKKHTLLSAALLFTGTAICPITDSYGGGIGVISSTTSHIVLNNVNETADNAGGKLDHTGNPNSSNNKGNPPNINNNGYEAAQLGFAMPTKDSMAQKIDAINNNKPEAPRIANNEGLEPRLAYKDPILPQEENNENLMLNADVIVVPSIESTGIETVSGHNNTDSNERDNGNNLHQKQSGEVEAEEENDTDIDTDIDTDADTDTDSATQENIQATDESKQPDTDSESAETSETTPTGLCSPEALEFGIIHYRYDDANPKDLVVIGGRRLHHDAAESLKEMRAAAKRDGVKLVVGSAFRSLKYQKSIIKRKEKRKLSAKKIYAVSAPAGYSEHSTGYVVDFSPIESSFAKTKAYRWLQNNAEQYGWQQSFTPEVSERNGVIVEPWHWRYIGTPEAKQLFEPKPCYE